LYNVECVAETKHRQSNSSNNDH